MPREHQRFEHVKGVGALCNGGDAGVFLYQLVAFAVDSVLLAGELLRRQPFLIEPGLENILNGWASLGLEHADHIRVAGEDHTDDTRMALARSNEESSEPAIARLADEDTDFVPGQQRARLLGGGRGKRRPPRQMQSAAMACSNNSSSTSKNVGGVHHL